MGRRRSDALASCFANAPNEWESANHDIYKYLQEARIDTDAYTTSLYWEVLNHLRSLRRRDDPFYVALPTNLLPGTAITSNAEVNEYNELKRDITIAENELSARDRFAADIEDQLQHAGRAVGVGRGLAVLAFFALGSIVVPLLPLPLAQDQYTSWHKWLVLALFGVGIALFFSYLQWLTRALNK